MAAESAGLLIYRVRGGTTEVLLVHPGGPFWKRKEVGAWSVPKGEIGPGEALVEVARREFAEELGSPAPDTDLAPLGLVRQAGGKIVHVWAAPGDLDVSRVSSSTFAMEWPPRSGKTQEFPEVDRAAWFDVPTARRMLVPAQVAFVDRLEALLRASDD